MLKLGPGSGEIPPPMAIFLNLNLNLNLNPSLLWRLLPLSCSTTTRTLASKKQMTLTALPFKTGACSRFPTSPLGQSLCRLVRGNGFALHLGWVRVTKTDWQGEAAWPRSLPHCACSRPVPAAQPPLRPGTLDPSGQCLPLSNAQTIAVCSV